MFLEKTTHEHKERKTFYYRRIRWSKLVKVEFFNIKSQLTFKKQTKQKDEKRTTH